MTTKGHITRANRIWTPEKLEVMHRLYATTADKDIADAIGMTIKQVVYRARKDGLRKTPEYMHKLRTEQAARAQQFCSPKKFMQKMKDSVIVPGARLVALTDSRRWASDVIGCTSDHPSMRTVGEMV